MENFTQEIESWLGLAAAVEPIAAQVAALGVRPGAGLELRVAVTGRVGSAVRPHRGRVAQVLVDAAGMHGLGVAWIEAPQAMPEGYQGVTYCRTVPSVGAVYWRLDSADMAIVFQPKGLGLPRNAEMLLGRRPVLQLTNDLATRAA